MSFYSATLNLKMLVSSPSFWDLRIFADICRSFADICRSFAEICRIFAGNFQRFRWQLLSLCSPQPSDIEKHPGHPIAFPRTKNKDFKSFRCLTSKSIVFRENR